MAVSIYIQEKEIENLIEFYNSKLKAIKLKKIELDNDEKSIRATLMQLKAKKEGGIKEVENAPYDFTPHGFDYSDKWTWAKKIEFAIKDANEPLTTNEIVDVLAKYEPDFEEGGSERKKAIASISSTLSVKAGLEDEEGKDFIRIDEGTGRSKFSLKESALDKVIKEAQIKMDNTLPTLNSMVDSLPF